VREYVENRTFKVSGLLKYLSTRYQTLGPSDIVSDRYLSRDSSKHYTNLNVSLKDKIENLTFLAVVLLKYPSYHEM